MAKIQASSLIREPDFESLDPKFLRSSDPISQITLLAAKEALAGFEGRQEEVGLIFGMDYGVYPTLATCLTRMTSDGYRAASPQEFALATPNIAHSLTCIQLKLKGPNTNVSCGSLSSLMAIGMASEFIDWGRAKTLLAGGALMVGEPLPALAESFGIMEPRTCAGFVRLGEGKGISGYEQRRLKNGDMGPLIRGDVDSVIYHPGPENSIQGLPELPATDVREFGGESLDAAGILAVIEASRRNERVLVAFRSLDGRDGASLVVASK